MKKEQLIVKDIILDNIDYIFDEFYKILRSKQRSVLVCKTSTYLIRMDNDIDGVKIRFKSTSGVDVGGILKPFRIDGLMAWYDLYFNMNGVSIPILKDWCVATPYGEIAQVVRYICYLD